MNEQLILVVQAAAVAANDFDLLCSAYSALGVSRRYAFAPVSDWERRRGVDACEAWLRARSTQTAPDAL